MIKLKQAVVVEGKYDKIKLANIIDGVIIETGGFGIFRDKEKLQMLRILAEKTGLILLTDSDVAGFKIRNYIAGSMNKANIINVYIPDVFGKEKRKDKPSAEGKLGVEGISEKLLLEALAKAGVLSDNRPPKTRHITKLDFYEDGLTGQSGSSEKRQKLLQKLDLPQHLTTNAMVTVLDTMLEYEDYRALVEAL